MKYGAVPHRKKEIQKEIGRMEKAAIRKEEKEKMDLKLKLKKI
jgi:hypothetical protein